MLDAFPTIALRLVIFLQEGLVIIVATLRLMNVFKVRLNQSLCSDDKSMMRCAVGLTFGELTQTQLGPVSFYAGDKGLLRVDFKPLNQLKEETGVTEDLPSFDGMEIIGVLLAEINEFLFGIRKTFSVPIDWRGMGEFQRQVLTMASQIPFGRVTTYGEIARRLGKPGSARAVGTALGSNPMPIIIPCHRVIGADGSLRGFAGGLDRKAYLLGVEGHTVNGDRMLNYSEVLQS